MFSLMLFSILEYIHMSFGFHLNAYWLLLKLWIRILNLHFVLPGFSFAINHCNYHLYRNKNLVPIFKCLYSLEPHFLLLKILWSLKQKTITSHRKQATWPDKLLRNQALTVEIHWIPCKIKQKVCELPTDIGMWFSYLLFSFSPLSFLHSNCSKCETNTERCHLNLYCGKLNLIIPGRSSTAS